MQQLSAINYGNARRLCAWCVLCVALLTYLLTLEPTASYWDCPEYIAVATGLQPGHPPGNPTWMLAARFFVNLAPAPEYRALAVNVMSAVCAALTVMLLFLTIEFLARRLVKPVTNAAALLTLGSAAVGSLAFCWSDSFWFSAVEAEVYAFSSLCTALLLWLTLVWYQKRRRPHADRYLLLVAYLTGLSVGVHELNLLCLPALLLVVVYGLRGELGKRHLLLALLIGLAGIALLLYGVIPGFMALARLLELICVNSWGWPFNSGLLLTWTAVMLLLIGLGLWLCLGRRSRRLRLLRLMRMTVWSLSLFFLGFSVYALLIVRSAANPPLDTGHPADIFGFNSYFARDQYGSAPLVYGAPFTAQPMRQLNVHAGDSSFTAYALRAPHAEYVRGVKGMPHSASSRFATEADSAANAALQARGSDWYQLSSFSFEQMYPPELNMWFPRMHSHSDKDVQGYYNWLGADASSMVEPDEVTLAVDSDGRPVSVPDGLLPQLRDQVRPTYLQNLQYFAVYQCAFMYWRYFMWNFVGRQNDYTGHGEPDAGNFITGIDPLDRAMLDVAADAPEGAGRGNPGRNVYFALPLLLGLAGLVYQLCSGKRGRRGALLVAVLFVLTGIAIVVYLNQGPTQARDRDYAFLGSWYAFCIWIGLGVLALHALTRRIFRHRPKTAAAVAAALALAVPVQMLTQTADDHDRSGRTAARDLAYNELRTTAPQAIIFSSYDNNIFPLWYMTEAEEYRTDVRVISFPYMSLASHSRQWSMPMRASHPLHLTASEGLLASSLLNNVFLGTDTTPTPALEALRTLYTDGVEEMLRTGRPYATLRTPRLYFVLGADTVTLDLAHPASGGAKTTADRRTLCMLDILATNAAQKHPRPIYWTEELTTEIFGGSLKPYLRQVGTLWQLDPARPGLDVRATARLALGSWLYGTVPGFLERGRIPYFDPVAAAKMARFRTVLLQCADSLSRGNYPDGDIALSLLDKVERSIPFTMVRSHPVAVEAEEPSESSEYSESSRYTDEILLMADIYTRLGLARHDRVMTQRGRDMRRDREKQLRKIEAYRQSLRPAYRPFITYRLEHLNSVLPKH